MIAGSLAATCSTGAKVGVGAETTGVLTTFTGATGVFSNSNLISSISTFILKTSEFSNSFISCFTKSIFINTLLYFEYQSNFLKKLLPSYSG